MAEPPIVADQIAEVVIKAAKDREAELDDQIRELDCLNVDDLEEIRRKRLEQMKSSHRTFQQKMASGHGEYDLIEEKEFFDVAKRTDLMVVHFFRPSTWRCEVMDKHLRQLCQKHWKTRFLKINAEKSSYLVERMHIWCLPSLVLCLNGKTEHTVVGFSEFRDGDEATTEEVEALLKKWGVLGDYED